MSDTETKTFDEQWPDTTGMQTHDALGVVYNWMPKPSYEEKYFETMEHDISDLRSKMIRAAQVEDKTPLDEVLWTAIYALESARNEASNRRHECLKARVESGIVRYSADREAAKGAR